MSENENPISIQLLATKKKKKKKDTKGIAYNNWMYLVINIPDIRLIWLDQVISSVCHLYIVSMNTFVLPQSKVCS